MWYLRSTSDAALCYSLAAGKLLTVGRKDSDVTILGDQSISRKHATLGVQDESSVILTDCKSKFGTCVNGKKLAAGERVTLHHNDIVKFGQGPTHTKFRLVCEPVVVCCSGMPGPAKARVRELAVALGGQLLSNWTPACTHLVMTNLLVTVKVVSALASCRPVVTTAWLEAAVRCKEEGVALPSCHAHQPEVVDPSITGHGRSFSFQPNYSRTSLFTGKTFYFLCQSQFERLGGCVSSAGGCSFLASTPDSVAPEQLTADQSVVLAPDGQLSSTLPAAERAWVERVKDVLSRRGLRTVQDSEVGFALLYMSTESHCSPHTTRPGQTSLVPLPPPSLSQRDPQPGSSTLPCTQPSAPDHDHDDTPSSGSGSGSILAPDSIGTEESAGPGAGPWADTGDTIKINETVRLRPKPKLSQSRGPTHSQGPAHAQNHAHQHLSRPPMPVSSVRGEVRESVEGGMAGSVEGGVAGSVEVGVAGRGAREEKPSVGVLMTSTEAGPREGCGFLTSTQAGPREGCGLQPATQTDDSSIVSVSQPQEEDQAPPPSILPGLRTSPNPSRLRLSTLKPHSTSSYTSTASQLLTSTASQLHTTTASQLHTSTASQLHTTTASQLHTSTASQLHASTPSQLHTSTPSQSTSVLAPSSLTSEADTKPLPSSKLLSSLFGKGKREVDHSLEEGLPPSKKLHLEHTEAGVHGNGIVAMDTSNGHTSSSTGSVLSGVWAGPDKPGPGRGRHSQRDLSLPGLPVKTETTPTSPKAMERTETESVHSVPPPAPVTHGGVVSGAPSFKTPARSTPLSATPFISARKRKRSVEAGEGGVVEGGVAGSSPLLAGLESSTQDSTQTHTQASTGLQTPFSSLFAPWGRRNKVVLPPSNLWDEDPLQQPPDSDEGCGPDLPCDPVPRVYRPMVTPEGFIRPRETPRLQAPIRGRFSHLGACEDEAPPLPSAPVRVEAVRLVVRGRGEGQRRRGEEEEGEEEAATTNRLKDYKKFRKVQVIPQGIPCLVGLKVHVPNSDCGEEWLRENPMEEEEEEEAGPSSGSLSQDLFRVAPSRAGRVGF